MRILIASFRKKELEAFVQHLNEAEGATRVEFVETDAVLVRAIKEEAPKLVIFDEGFAGKSARDNIISVLQANAFVHTALLTAQDPDVLHDALEGLGIAAVLPLLPSQEEAAQLITIVKQLG